MVGPATGLRIAITARGLADKQVAERAKIHPTRLSRLLHERERITPATGQRLVRAVFPECFEEVHSDPSAA